MDLEIENLKELLKGTTLNIYQRGDALIEFAKVLKYIRELEQLKLTSVSSSVSLTKQKRVMFKFDNDEPMHLNSIFEGGEFTLTLKEGNIKFEKGGKSFELYIE